MARQNVNREAPILMLRPIVRGGGGGGLSGPTPGAAFCSRGLSLAWLPALGFCAGAFAPFLLLPLYGGGASALAGERVS